MFYYWLVGLKFLEKESINSFELDSAYYLSTPDYIWDALLRSSGFNLRLISVIEKHQLIESTVSGCIYLFIYRTMLKQTHHISYTQTLIIYMSTL